LSQVVRDQPNGSSGEFTRSESSVSDDYRGTPLWGWAIILAAVAMFVALIYKSLSTGGTH